MLLLQNISYIHSNSDRLFENIHLSLQAQDKIALIGNNGSGKSTLLRIIAGELVPATGQVIAGAVPYYVPQIFGQFDQLTVAQALRISPKLQALQAILRGDTSESHFEEVGDDWTLEERCQEALAHWQLDIRDLSQPMGMLSGGQKTKVFLAGIAIHRPRLVLLDEPSNHLDGAARELLYEQIGSVSGAWIVVSHDRALLNLLSPVYELGKEGLTQYGGNYDFYKEQKELEENALAQDIQSREKALRKAREKKQETMERQQKLDARGKGKQEKAGVARIMLNTLRNNAENSTAKLKNAHSEKIGQLSSELRELRAANPETDPMRLGFASSGLHTGKVLFRAEKINLRFADEFLWKDSLSFQLNSGERIAVKGRNGSGKTSLIKVILGELEPATGTVFRAPGRTVYIDQDYSLIDNRLSVFEQASLYNTSNLQEHEIGSRLSRFLFGRGDWEKSCGALSGGERMRLALCCLTIGEQAPDLIVLDEPTNNLDLGNLEILSAAIRAYHGTLVMVSHDERFQEEVGVEREIGLSL